MIVGELRLNENPSVQKIKLIRLSSCPTLYMVRLDTLYGFASGNKMYKLVGFVNAAKLARKRQLLSFGGPYSNHIHALAALANHVDMESIGIIRGEQALIRNQTLSDAVAAGMKLKFVSRDIYRRRYDDDFLQKLQKTYPDAQIIPEGGASLLGVEGSQEIPIIVNNVCPDPVDIFCCAVGTGTTLAGVVNGLAEHQRAIGYKIPRDDLIATRVQSWVQPACGGKAMQYSLVDADYGGFAKMDRNLVDCVLDWYDQTGILLDPIYTSKMCLKITRQIEQGIFDKNETLAIVHSGGLQGWSGMKSRVIQVAGIDAWSTIDFALQKTRKVKINDPR